MQNTVKINIPKVVTTELDMEKAQQYKNFYNQVPGAVLRMFRFLPFYVPKATSYLPILFMSKKNQGQESSSTVS